MFHKKMDLTDTIQGPALDFLLSCPNSFLQMCLLLYFYKQDIHLLIQKTASASFTQIADTRNPYRDIGYFSASLLRKFNFFVYQHFNKCRIPDNP